MGPSEAAADIAAPERMQGWEEEEEEEDVVRAAHCPAHRAAGSSPEGVRKRWEGSSSQGGQTGGVCVPCWTGRPLVVLRV